MALEFNRTLRLSANQYIGEKYEKDLLVLHHTVGASAKSTFDWWQKTPERIATPFIIERNGDIYEVFDPSCWAYHLGKGIPTDHNQRSIGIEIASEGPLEKRGEVFYALGSVFKGTVYDHGQKWRDYRYFAAYTPKQMDAVVALVNYLCDTFAIIRQTPANHYDYNEELLDYQGVIGHHHVRRDKSDVHPGFGWGRLIQECRLAIT